VQRHALLSDSPRTLTIHRGDFPRARWGCSITRVDDELAALFDSQDGVATASQILAVASRRHLEMLLECTAVERIWRGVYSRGTVDTARRLKGLDLACGEVVAICMATAAGAYGFDIQDTADLHVLNPVWTPIAFRRRSFRTSPRRRPAGRGLRSAGDSPGLDGRRSGSHTAPPTGAGHARCRAPLRAL